MKSVLLLIVLIAAAYVGYTYYIGPRSTGLASPFSTKIVSGAPSFDTSSIFNVLGTTTSNLYEKATGALNTATNGKAEPLINKAVSDLQDRVKNLPAEEYKRVKYEFCKDVFPSPTPLGK